MFLENILNMSFDCNINNFGKLNECKLEKNSKKYEFLDIQNYLDRKINEINSFFNKNITKLSFVVNDSPHNCILNTKLAKITQKEYLNDNTKCDALAIEKNFGKKYMNCIKNFNSNLKYFELLLKEENKVRNQEKVKNEENNIHNEVYEKFEDKVLKSFFSKVYKKIYQNILKSYEYLYSKNKSLKINRMEEILSLLIELRDYIYEEKSFDFLILQNIMKSIPIKYMTINLVYSEDMSKDGYKFEDFRFTLGYSNRFVQYTINKIINDYADKIDAGSGFGAEFEKKVNNKISHLVFCGKNLIKRNIFSLVGLTKSTKNYVNKKREKEKFELYEFYGLKRFNVQIDGIDKIDEISSVNIKENSIYLNQISKTGRSFDLALLIKKENIKNNETHDLVLCQDSINKLFNSNKRDKYIEDSYKVNYFLEGLYPGLVIDEIYFIFIIPQKYNNNDRMISQLNKLQIYCVYFDYSKNIFLNSNGEIINDFRIKEANIKCPPAEFNFMKALMNIHICRDIFNLSKKKYFQKKKNKNFIDIYEKTSTQYFHECVKFFIPLDLKKEILKTFYFQKFEEKTYINFIPSANYIGPDIEKLFNETKNMIIFSFNNNTYLYYYNYFIINKDFSINKIKGLNINQSNEISTPKNNLDNLNQLKDYPLYCFCYYVVKDYSIDY